MIFAHDSGTISSKEVRFDMVGEAVVGSMRFRLSMEISRKPLMV